VPNLPVTAKINKKGVLEIGGCSATDLVAQFGTPLYVMDDSTIRERCREYKTSFKSKYRNVEIVFASKALCTTGILNVISDEGLGVDVVSGGELSTALRAGCDPEKIYFHGNNKSLKELEEGLRAGIGRFVVDCFEELKNLDSLTSKTGVRADILFRVNPGIEAHTHEFIKTGQVDSKFGLSREKVLEAISLASSMKNVNFVGLHSHIGSQIFDVNSFVAELDVLLNIAKETAGVEEINIGGGLGIDYLEKKEAPAIESFASVVTAHLNKRLKELKIPEPKLVLEPGRSIVGQAGVTLYTIGVIKEIPGIRKYVSVDGGMADNPRPMLYQSVYDATIGNKADKKKNEKVTISGRYCESGDVLLKDVMLQGPSVGDILVVLCTGAYNYSMASNYNRVPRPAMVLVSKGDASLIIGRETYEDLSAKDVAMQG
jgi:diaminopimelate decarboxylase